MFHAEYLRLCVWIYLIPIKLFDPGVVLDTTHSLVLDADDHLDAGMIENLINLDHS